MTMISAGNSATVQLDVGQLIRFNSTSGRGSITRVVTGSPGSTAAITGASAQFGPFDDARIYRVECVSGVIDYTVGAAWETLERSRRQSTVKTLLARSIARAAGKFPILDASNVAVTIGADGVSAITGTRYDAKNVPERFTFMRGNWGPATNAFPGTEFVNGRNVKAIAAQATQFPGGNGLVRFASSAPDLEIVTNSGQAGYRLKVDGAYIVQGVIAHAGGNGDYRYARVKWGDGSAANRKMRIYEVEFFSDGWFGGVKQSPAEALNPAPVADNARGIVFGDSFVGGANTQTNAALIGSMGSTIAALMGQTDVLNSGVGSSGFLANPNSGISGTPVSRFGERLQSDVIAFTPAWMVEMGGINDGSLASANPSLYLSLVSDFYIALINALPNILVFMTGPMSPNSGLNVSTDNVLVRNIKKNVASMFPDNVMFIDNIAEAWVTGSGKVGSTTGTGPSDWITGADGTHPSDDGVTYLARRIVDAIGARLT